MWEEFPYDKIDKLDEVTPEPKKRVGGSFVDKKIFYCESCKSCWQYICYVRGRRSNRLCEHYEDFPSINKKRKVCPKCQKR